MKNRLFALTAAAVLAVSLTACGSKAEEPAAADTKAEAAEETASADTTGEKKVLKAVSYTHLSRAVAAVSASPAWKLVYASISIS